MRVFDIALKDLSQILRDKLAALFLVIMPVAFTVAMGFALKGVVAPPDPRLALGWANPNPEDVVIVALYKALEESGAVRLVAMTDVQAERQVRGGQLAGAVVLPTAYGARALAGQPLPLTLVADEMSAAGQTLAQVVRGALTRTFSAAELARLSVAAVEARRPIASAAARQEEMVATLMEVRQAWSESTGGARVVVEKAEGKTAQNLPLGGNPYNQTSPGILLQFAIMSLVTCGGILVQERRTGTLQRLLTTNLAPWQIIGGHFLGMFALVLGQQVVLVLFGQFALGVNYLRQPLGTLLVMVGLAWWVTGLGLFISAVAKGEEQVILFSLIAMFLFTGLGGAWMPLEGSGPAFAAVGKLTPGAWAMTGFQNILIRGLGLGTAITPALILLGYGMLFLALAVWRLRRQF